ncbi:hypothetical protein [Nonomuraea sp. NPDC002799]
MHPITSKTVLATANVIDPCVYCKTAEGLLRLVVGVETLACAPCAEIVENAYARRLPDQPAVDQARANTDTALQALKDLIASGVDVGATGAFLDAFLVEMTATRAEMDQMAADVEGAAAKVQEAQDYLLLSFRWGGLAAAQIAHDLDLSGSEMHQLTEDHDSVFTLAERQQLTSALNDVLDARKGVTVAGWTPVPMPFDALGRCGSPACRACRTETVAATA